MLHLVLLMLCLELDDAWHEAIRRVPWIQGGLTSRHGILSLKDLVLRCCRFTLSLGYLYNLCQQILRFLKLRRFELLLLVIPKNTASSSSGCRQTEQLVRVWCLVFKRRFTHDEAWFRNRLGIDHNLRDWETCSYLIGLSLLLIHYRWGDRTLLTSLKLTAAEWLQILPGISPLQLLVKLLF